MIQHLLLLSLLGVTLGRPQTEELYIPHELCPDDIHWLLPHEYDCTKFYYCEYGLKWIAPRDCAPGTEFSYSLQVCIHPELANCNLPGSPTESTGDAVPSTDDPTTEAYTPTQPPVTTEAVTETDIIEEATTPQPPTETPTQPPATTESATETDVIEEITTPQSSSLATTEAYTTTNDVIVTTIATQPPTESPTLEEQFLPNGCPSNFSVHYLLAHETNCSLFYQCSNGDKILKSCPEGTLFDYTYQWCGQAEWSSCNQQGPTETPGVTEPSAPVPDVDEDLSSVDLLPNGCPKDIHVHHLLPHETDCDKFYYCVMGEKIERGCAPGTYFNANLQVCDWPENVDCANGSEDDGSNDNEEVDDGSPDDNEEVDGGNPDDNEEVDGGNPDDNEEVDGGNPDDNEEVDGGNPDDNDNDNEEVDGDNPDDNEEVDDGNPDDNDNDNEEVDGGNPDDNEEIDGDNPDDNDNEEGTTPDEDDEVPEGILPNGCPADFDVHKLLPHETECDKFYYCVFGEKVERACAPGTYFNYEIQTGKRADVSPDAKRSAPPMDTNINGGNGDNGGSGNGGNGNDDDVDSGEWDTLPNGCPADFEVHQLLPHENNCSLFYYCVFGEKVERVCAPGTHFNPTLQVCDWPWRAGCESEDSNVGDGDNGGNDNDNDGDDSDNDGSDGGNDSDNGESDDGNDNETDGENDNGETDGENDNGDTDGGNDNDNGETDGGNDNGGDDNDDDNIDDAEWNTLPNGCPRDFDVHQLLPHESDCSRFYYCVFGEKVERECAPGTHFNPTLQVCDWPWNAGCDLEDGNGGNDNGGSDNDDSGSGDDGGNSGDSDGDSGVDGITLENGCPADFDLHKLLPHETNCSRFYYCVFGERVERECAPGLHFSPVNQVCDWPWRAGCESDSDNGGNGDNGGSGDNGDDGGNGDNGGSGDSGDDGGNEDNDGDNSSEDGALDATLPNGCPADFDTHKLLPHETNCSLFYYCVFGEKVERQCPTGTHFNPVIQVCDWPWSAGCEIDDNGDSGSGDSGNGDSGNGDSGSGDSGNGDSGSGDSGNGDSGSGDSGNGDSGSGDSCNGDNGSGDSGNGDSGSGDSGNGDSGSGDNGNGDSGSGDSGNGDSGSGDSGSGDSGNGDSGSGDGGNGDNGAIGGGNKCENGCNVLPWAHDTDCDKFYVCSGGQPVLVTCSEGLHFNANTYTCDFKCNTNCVRDDVQATAESDGVKLFLPWDKLDENLARFLGIKNRL